MPRGWFPKLIECPYCGNPDARYIPEYDQYFCDVCKIYLPKGYGPTRSEPYPDTEEEPEWTGKTMADPNGQCMYCPSALVKKDHDPESGAFNKELWFCHNCSTYQPEGFKGDDSGPTASHCPYCGGENEGGKSNFVKVDTPAGEEDQLFCKKCNTFLPRGWKHDNGGVDPEIWTSPQSRIPMVEYDYRLKEWHNHSCLKTKHWGPFRLVKPYDQYLCEHCNYFLKIGHQPDIP